jgi:2-polyprenyl-3-methyl-5-hydroxy-6-metoxy-1,4-benzoquinol methylase
MSNTQISVELFNNRAKEYQDKFMDLDYYDNTLDLFCSYIDKKNAEILDLACGPGNISKYLFKKRSDFNILGIDLAENMLALAKENNPKAQYELMDCRAISKLQKKYDGIVCGFGLPYLSKEEAIELISTSHKILNPHGLLYLSTMEADYGTSGLKKSATTGEEIFIYYHQENYLSEALKSNGFKILEMIRQDYPEADGSMTVDLILIAQKECVLN